MTSLYICCESGNQPPLTTLFERLKKEHYHLLNSADQTQPTGWRQAMKTGIRNCDQVLLVFTDTAFRDPAFVETVAYALKLGRPLAYHDQGHSISHALLTALGLRPEDLTRIRLEEPWNRGIRGLLPSASMPLGKERDNNPGKQEKSLWLRYIADRLGRVQQSQVEFVRHANQYLEPYNQYPDKAVHNLFDYTRGTPLPIVQLLAYIRTFKDWLSDYTQADALEFLHLSCLTETDMLRIQPRLQQMFRDKVQINPAFPEKAAPFICREVELDDLYELLVIREQKIVTLEGRPGIGKTELAKETINRLRQYFDLIYWQELQTPITAEQFITQFLSFAAPGERFEVPLHTALLQVLRHRRCLIVFDHFESLLDQDNHYHKYRPVYGDYDLLLHDVATQPQQSALLFTTSYTPATFAGDIAIRYAGGVSRYCVNGLDPTYTQAIAADAGIRAAQDDLARLHNHFSGHPVAIKDAVQKIKDGHYAAVTDYLEHAPRVGDRVKATVFDLEQASPLALKALYWLAIEREYVALERLYDLMQEGRAAVEEAMRPLMTNFLIERHPSQPYKYRVRSDVLDYIIERLIDRMTSALVQGEIEVLHTHALKLAGSKDYIRAAQHALLVQPVANRLVEKVGERQAARALSTVLERLRLSKWNGRRGFAAANVLHILDALNLPFDGWDFSDAHIREVDARKMLLQNVNFAGVALEDCLFKEDFASVLSLAFDSTGHRMAAGTTNGRIHLWDLAEGGQKWATQGTEVWIHAVAFSADGKRLITADSHGWLGLWDTADGRLLDEPLAQLVRGRVTHLAITSDDKLATVGDDGFVRLWQVEPYHITLLWEAGPFESADPDWARLYQTAFHPGERMLAVVGEQKIVYLLDVDNGDLLAAMSGHSAYIQAVTFHPNGRLLATAAEDHTVRFWDVETGDCLQVLVGHTNTPLSLAFARDGKMLVSGGIDKTICLWDVETGAMLKQLQGHYRWVRAVRFRPLNGGEQLVSAGDDKTICFWDIERGEVIASRQGTQLGARAMAVSDKGEYLAVSRDSLDVTVWEISTGKLQYTLEYRFNSWVRALAFRPDGRALAVAHENCIILFDTATGKVIDDFPAYPDQEFVWSLEYTPIGNYLISAGGDEPKQIILWDTDRRQRTVISDSHLRWILQAKPSPDGRWIASSSDDGGIKIWSRENQAVRWQQSNVYDHTIWMLAFTPDGRLVSATQEPSDPVIVWEVNDEHLRPVLRIYTGHARKVTALAVTEGGQTLVTGGDDGLLFLWNLETGAALPDGVIRAYDAPIHTIVDLRSGRIIATGSVDPQVKFWDAGARQQVQALAYLRPYEGMNLTGATGLSASEHQSLKTFGAVEEG